MCVCVCGFILAPLQKHPLLGWGGVGFNAESEQPNIYQHMDRTTIGGKPPSVCSSDKGRLCALRTRTSPGETKVDVYAHATAVAPPPHISKLHVGAHLWSSRQNVTLHHDRHPRGLSRRPTLKFGEGGKTEISTFISPGVVCPDRQRE